MEDEVYRQVNTGFANHYENFISSGLYSRLVSLGYLIAHNEVNAPFKSEDHYKTLKMEKLPFISFPYEWCFQQLQDAALLTLSIQLEALNLGFTLKDATAFNIQFKGSQPIFIDTLSFELWQPEDGWRAYKQFCEHFLAPLALMYYRDDRLVKLFQTTIDGISLDLASKLLPFRSWFSFGIVAHLHLHSMAQHSHNSKGIQSKKAISQTSLIALIRNLESVIRRMRPAKKKSTWRDYYSFTNYGEESSSAKELLVSQIIDRVNPCIVWDFGANTGRYGRLASSMKIPVISFDFDYQAITSSYSQAKKEKDQWFLPLIADFSNPSPSLGWAGQERESLERRGPADLLMALALIHHLTISNNVPFKEVARWFSSLCSWLLIEFVPIDDSQVKRLLATRKGDFSWYTPENFQYCFSEYFTPIDSFHIVGSSRELFLMKSKL